jgi:hypothetical protein
MIFRVISDFELNGQKLTKGREFQTILYSEKNIEGNFKTVVKTNLIEVPEIDLATLKKNCKPIIV